MVEVNGVMQITTDTAKGVQLSASAISKLAQQDAIQATNIMSQLVNKNLIDMETMIKVFNGRYGLIVSNMLRTINGDIIGYSEELNKAISVTKDYETQMNNLNNQFAIMKSNWANLKSEYYGMIKSMADFGAEKINTLLETADKGAVKTIIGMTSIISTVGSASLGAVTYVGNLALAVKALHDVANGSIPIFSTLLSKLGLFIMNPYVGAITLIASALGMMGLSAMNTSRRVELLANELDFLKAKINETTLTTKQLNAQWMALKASSLSLNLVNITKQFGDLSENLTTIATQYSSMKTSLDSVSSSYMNYLAILNTSKTNTATSDMTKEILDLENQLKSAKKEAGVPISVNLFDIGQIGAEGFGKLLNSTEGIWKAWSNGSDYLRNKEKDRIKVVYELELQLAEKRKGLAEADMKTQSDLLNAKGEYQNALTELNAQSNSIMYQSYVDMLSKTKAKTAQQLLDRISSFGQFGSSFARTLKNVASKLGEVLTVDNLKDEGYLKALMEYRDVVNSLSDAEEMLAESRRSAQDTPEQQETLANSVEFYRELAKIAKDRLNNFKSEKMVMLNILELNSKYEMSKIKQDKLNQSELTYIQTKINETIKLYDIESSNDEYNLKSKFKIKNFTIKSLEARMSYLKKEKGELESNVELTKEQESSYKDMVDEYNSIDEYLSKQVDYQKQLVSLEYDKKNATREAKDDYYSMLISMKNIGLEVTSQLQ